MAISAKFTADFTSFHSAVQKAEVQLRSFEQGAGKVEKSLARMTDSFSGRKVIQDATLMVSAVERIGGVSKLTTSELQKLGGVAGEAVEKMKRLGIDVPPGLKKIADATRDAKAPTDSLNVSFGKLVASYVSAEVILGTVKAGFRAVTGFIAESVKAANDAEKAQAQLVAALRAQGTAVPSVIKAYQGYAEALQRTTIFQDDAIAGAQALLVQVGGVMPREMEKALQATVNLASGLGVDLHTATLQVAKAAEGQTGSLKKAGVVIDETKLKAQGFGAVLDAINEKFGGQAQALAGTYAGRLTQLKNSWNDLQESVGRLITTNQTVLALFGEINTKLGVNKDALEQNQAAVNLVSQSVIIAVRAFGLLAKGIDFAQTVAAGFLIGLRTLGIGLLEVGKAAVTAGQALLLSQGQLKAAIDLGALKGQLDQAIQERKKANADLTHSSVQFGNALTGIAASAAVLEAKLEKTRGKTVALTGATEEATGVWDRQTTSVTKNTKAMTEAEKIRAMLTGADTRADVTALAREWSGLTVAERENELSVKRLVAAYEALRANLAPSALPAELERVRNAFREASKNALIGKVEGQARAGLAGLVGSTVNPFVEGLEGRAVGGLNGLFGTPGGGAAKSSTLAKGALMAGLTDFPNLLLQSFTGGGGAKGALNAVGVKIGIGLFGKGGALEKGTAAVTGSLSAMFGKAVGGALGAAIPGIGALIGPGIELLMKGIGKLFGFGESDAEKTAKMRKAWLADLRKAGTSVEELSARAAKAGYNMDRLMNADKVKDFQREVERLQKAIAFQDAAVKDLDDAIQRWGFSIEELSPALQKQRLHEQSGQLLKDFKLLSGAGVSVEAIFSRMSGVVWETLEDGTRKVKSVDAGFVQLVRDAARLGVALPTAMKPILQQMIDLGLLTDDQGHSFGSLEEAGVSFTDAVTDGFKSMVEAIHEMVGAIRLFLGIASEAEQKAYNLQRQIREANDQIAEGGFLNDFIGGVKKDRAEAELAAITGTVPPPPVSGDAPRVGPLGFSTAATGGLVTMQGIQKFGMSGKVLPFPGSRVSGFGRDTQLIAAEPGELILNAAHQKGLVSALSAPRGGSATSLSVSIDTVNIGENASEFETELEIGRRAVRAMKSKGIRFRKKNAA